MSLEFLPYSAWSVVGWVGRVGVYRKEVLLDFLSYFVWSAVGEVGRVDPYRKVVFFTF